MPPTPPIDEVKRVLTRIVEVLKDAAHQVESVISSLGEREEKTPHNNVITENLGSQSELKKGPPKRLPPDVMPHAQQEKNIESAPITKMDASLTEEKKSLSRLTDKMHGLLDKLKKDVILEPTTPKASPFEKGKSSLSQLKERMSGLYDKLKTFTNEDQFYNMTETQRKQALKDMADAINFLTNEYHKTTDPS